MDDLISRAAAVDALGEEPLVWRDSEDEIAERNQWRRDVAAIKALPSVDAAPVVPELEAVVEELNAMYACAKDQMWIRNPVLWALYQVWQKHESMEG